MELLRVHIATTFWVALVSLSAYVWAQEPEKATTLKPAVTSEAADEDLIGQKRASEEIAVAVAAYAKAFNDRDVETLQSLWTKDGVYSSRSTGERILGRESIAGQFADIFADDAAPQLALVTESVNLISPGVALERGRAIVTRGDRSEESLYRVVFVNRDGKWLIDRVEETAAHETPPSQYEHLRKLEWMVGAWIDQGEGFSLDISCEWTRNKNFLARKFKLSNSDGTSSSGLQLIGWDAKEKQIRSWLFDSDGTVVTGKWLEKDGTWYVPSVATLADGTTGSFTSVFEPEANSYGWKKIHRVQDGRLLPNVDWVRVQQKQ
jgi:uncharacterized protein (TIGR02246 family)